MDTFADFDRFDSVGAYEQPTKLTQFFISQPIINARRMFSSKDKATEIKQIDKKPKLICF